jgi:propanol-preferring alcohol dehydrogenase
LCSNARFTGYTRDGGYAEATIADARYAFRIPNRFDDAAAAPLLCAGLIGYRAYRMAGAGRRLGLYGFGAAAHLLAQVAIHEGRELYAFTSPGDSAAQALARSLGCVWAGASTENPPEHLDAAIIFAPVGALVPRALAQVVPAGVVVCAGIHMSEIPGFPYELLWKERVIRSVANLTRQDAHEFLALAPSVPVITHVQKYDLHDANQALADLRGGHVNGAAVLVVER